MTTFIFHSSRCLMLTKGWPPKPKDFTEQLAYDQAKQEAIDSAVEVDRLEDVNYIKRLCYYIANPNGIILDPWLNGWQPAEDTVYSLEIEMETQHQYKNEVIREWHNCTGTTYQMFERSKAHPVRQVARIKKEHLPKRDESNRDWPEDYNQENGNYQNKCIGCGLLFYGNKHRVICKQCSEPKEPAPEHGEWVVYLFYTPDIYCLTQKGSYKWITHKDKEWLQSIADSLNAERKEHEREVLNNLIFTRK